MALDFPASPTNGQVFNKWTWDGTTWVLTPGTSSGISQADADIRYVNVAGDTMTGALTIGTGGTRLSMGPAGALQLDGGTEGVVHIHHSGKRPYYAWFGGTDGARRGYLGYPNTTDNESVLVSEGGQMTVKSAGNVKINGDGTNYYDSATHQFRSANGATLWAVIDGITGLGGILFPGGGGGWYMSDTTYMRCYGNKTIYTAGNIRCDGTFHKYGTGYMLTNDTDTDTGVYYWTDGMIGFVSNGMGCIGAKSGGAMAGDMVQAHEGTGYNLNVNTGSPSTWGTSNVLMTNFAGGNVQIGFHTGGVAPILKGYSGAERLEARNGGDTAFCPIHASAFTVNSSADTKLNIAYLDDAAVLARVRPAKQVSFLPSIRPQNTVTTEDNEFTTIDHVCGTGWCEGTLDDPCMMTTNDHDKIGLVAEEVFEYFPECVDLDENGAPAGIDIAQVATASFAAVGALIRKIETLEARIASLEAA